MRMKRLHAKFIQHANGTSDKIHVCAYPHYHPLEFGGCG